MTAAAPVTTQPLLDTLRTIVGKRYLHAGDEATERFRTGWRSGGGEALAAVEPGTLVELWRVLQATTEADAIVIMQAANTGLTEGSAPSGSYDRDVVVVNTLRLDTLHVIDEGRQVISLPGGTLYKLEELLAPHGREAHSVIGSTCIGASVIGGVCNNSGGALVQRGPVYTELSLFAQRQADGSLALVNHLGIELGDAPETMLQRLEQGDFSLPESGESPGKASSTRYPDKVRDVTADTPARYNADPQHLHEASGCAGKLAVFAVRLDTFPARSGDRVYYLGTNHPGELTVFRQRFLSDISELPISGEYLHRDIFDIARDYGKDTLLMIHWLGTRALPFFFSMKGRIDARLGKSSWVPDHLIDRSLQWVSRWLPNALPRRMLEHRERFEHHLILKVSESCSADAENLMSELFDDTQWFLCTEAEAGKAMLHRFAAAGAAVRYQVMHDQEVEAIIALDIALRRNDEDWFETLPDEISKDLLACLYYGHFFCHVFHQDYVVRKGADAELIKVKMLELLNRRGAEYPAEHNVGHLYEAKPALADFYESLDPTNSFNPGIGKTGKQKHVVH